MHQNNLWPQITNIHLASKETYHLFRATHTKTQSIKMNHIWTQSSHSYPYQAQARGQILKITEIARLQGREIVEDKSRYSDYITHH